MIPVIFFWFKYGFKYGAVKGIPSYCPNLANEFDFLKLFFYDTNCNTVLFRNAERLNSVTFGINASRNAQRRCD